MSYDGYEDDFEPIETYNDDFEEPFEQEEQEPIAKISENYSKHSQNTQKILQRWKNLQTFIQLNYSNELILLDIVTNSNETIRNVTIGKEFDQSTQFPEERLDLHSQTDEIFQSCKWTQEPSSLNFVTSRLCVGSGNVINSVDEKEKKSNKALLWLKLEEDSRTKIGALADFVLKTLESEQSDQSSKTILSFSGFQKYTLVTSSYESSNRTGYPFCVYQNCAFVVFIDKDTGFSCVESYDGKERFQFFCKSLISSICASDRYLIAGCNDGCVVVWKRTESKPFYSSAYLVLSDEIHHVNSVISVCFLDNSTEDETRSFASLDTGGNVIFWSIKVNGLEIMIHPWSWITLKYHSTVKIFKKICSNKGTLYVLADSIICLTKLGIVFKIIKHYKRSLDFAIDSKKKVINVLHRNQVIQYCLDNYDILWEVALDDYSSQWITSSFVFGKSNKINLENLSQESCQNVLGTSSSVVLYSKSNLYLVEFLI